MPIQLELVLENTFDINRLNEIIPIFLNYINQEMYRNLMLYSPVEHGRLRGAWNRQNEGGQLIFQNATYYAIFQNDGTYSYGPLRRKPKTKEVGGIKPKRFVEKSIEDTGNRLQEFLNMAVNEVDL